MHVSPDAPLYHASQLTGMHARTMRTALHCPHRAQINERYLPQLATLLTWPQAVGIVGGRPGASLFFVGVQGASVLYLDPHDVQQVRRWWRRRQAKPR
jgi:Peptidase family C54